MENMLNGEMLDEAKVGDVLDNRAAGVKGFLIGAVFVGGAWIGSSLYKRFKNSKSEEREFELVDESEREEA